MRQLSLVCPYLMVNSTPTTLLVARAENARFSERNSHRHGVFACSFPHVRQCFRWGGVGGVGTCSHVMLRYVDATWRWSGWYVAEVMFHEKRRGIWGSTSHINLFLGWRSLVLNKIKFFDLGKYHSWLPWCRKNGRSGHDLLVVLDLSLQTKLLFF